MSMKRFADELEYGLRAQSRFAVGSTRVAQTHFAKLGTQRLDAAVARLLRYPLKVSRQRSELYHVVDQSYAHVTSLVSKERTIVTCHDLILLLGEGRQPELRGPRGTTLRFKWTSSYLRRAAHVVCVSRSTAADVSELCGVPEERISVVPNGLGRCFRPLPREVANRLKAQIARGGSQIILHVGAPVSYKNIAGTIEVLKALRAASIDVILVRVGPSLTGKELALAQKLGLSSAIIECGLVSEERLVELYNACDVLLFPSLYEGFGWPPLEAMACGTPVVSSNRGALPEVVADAGLVADPIDIEALARATRRVLESDDLRQDLRCRGIAQARKFTWDQTIKGYVRVYEHVLAHLDRTGGVGNGKSFLLRWREAGQAVNRD